MRIDAQHVFSDAQALTTTAMATNIFDFGQDNPRIIGGEDLFLECKVGVSLATGTNVTVKVWTDDTTTTTDGEDIITGDLVITANAVAGKVLLRVNLKGLNLQRYLGVQYVIVGTYDAGNVNTAFVITPDTDAMTLT